MSRFSRAHDEYLTPPGGSDPHPWSEELCGILEDAGLQQDEVDHAVRMFDKALEAEHVIPLTVDDLLSQASMCRELDHDHAIFWRNREGRDDYVSGESYADVLAKVITTLRGDDLTPEADAISDYLWDLVEAKKLGDQPFEKACEVLEKLKRTYVYTATPTAAADSERLDWLVAKGAPAVQYLAMAEPETWRERIDAARHQEATHA